MSDLALSAAFSPCDRTAALRSGEIEIEGVRLEVLTLPPGEIFRRMCATQAFHVSEMSMGAHIALAGRGESPFVGLPAFPSRAFRHAMVYVNVDAGIGAPEDLNGKRIAVREWGMTAVVWIIGILAEHHGLDLRSVSWRAAMAPRVPMAMPDGVQMRLLDPEHDIVALLERGEVDAALVLEAPSSWASGTGRVRRLFPDYARREREYHATTGMHPIMHTVVLRRDVHESHPWVARRLLGALEHSRERARDALLDSGVLSAMVPHLPSVMDETRAQFGEDFWPYGIDANRNELECLLRYAREQGLTRRELAVEALFGCEFGRD